MLSVCVPHMSRAFKQNHVLVAYACAYLKKRMGKTYTSRGACLVGLCVNTSKRDFNRWEKQRCHAEHAILVCFGVSVPQDEESRNKHFKRRCHTGELIHEHTSKRDFQSWQSKHMTQNTPLWSAYLKMSIEMARI